jgi:hypothetical protein
MIDVPGTGVLTTVNILREGAEEDIRHYWGLYFLMRWVLSPGPSSHHFSSWAAIFFVG